MPFILDIMGKMYCSLVIESTLPKECFGRIAMVLITSGYRKSGGFFLCYFFLVQACSLDAQENCKRGKMHCYLCFTETGNVSRPAMGLCSACGTGICERHLIVIASKPVVGMVSQIARRHIYCASCYGQQASPYSNPPRSRQMAKASPWATWWKRIQGKQEYALMEPEEALRLVEEYLKKTKA